MHRFMICSKIFFYQFFKIGLCLIMLFLLNSILSAIKYFLILLFVTLLFFNGKCMYTVENSIIRRRHKIKRFSSAPSPSFPVPLSEIDTTTGYVVFHCYVSCNDTFCAMQTYIDRHTFYFFIQTACYHSVPCIL